MNDLLPRGFGAVLLLFAATVLLSARPPERAHFTPRFNAGQTLFYRIEFHATRDATAESRFDSPLVPPAGRIDFSGLLQVHVSEATPHGFRLKTYLSERHASASSSQTPPASSNEPDKAIEFSLSPTGIASRLTGFDRLSASQQAAWSAWLARFTSSMAFPSTLRIGQKWQATEGETAPSPIAGLLWTKKFEYARDESCPAEPATSSAKLNNAGSPATSCAVVLVTATLRQKSSRQNATPPDFKLHNLKSQGAASGRNETILYLSRSQGILIRSTESAQQSMDVTITLADGSNRVHYSLDAKSRSEIFLLTDSPQ